MPKVKPDKPNNNQKPYMFNNTATSGNLLNKQFDQMLECLNEGDRNSLKQDLQSFENGGMTLVDFIDCLTGAPKDILNDIIAKQATLDKYNITYKEFKIVEHFSNTFGLEIDKMLDKVINGLKEPQKVNLKENISKLHQVLDELTRMENEAVDKNTKEQIQTAKKHFIEAIQNLSPKKI